MRIDKIKIYFKKIFSIQDLTIIVKIHLDAYTDKIKIYLRKIFDLENFVTISKRTFGLFGKKMNLSIKKFDFFFSIFETAIILIIKITNSRIK